MNEFVNFIGDHIAIVLVVIAVLMTAYDTHMENKLDAKFKGKSSLDDIMTKDRE